MADYIDREAAKIAIMAVHCYTNGRIARKRVEEAAEAIVRLPAADVAPVVHGRWIEDHDYLKCPECGVMVKRDFTFFDIGNWNYCPNCGAQMDGDKDQQRVKLGAMPI